MGFKVPIGYEEADDGGLNVVYDNDTEQSMHFIPTGGGSGGGSDSVIFNISWDLSNALDKSWLEIKTALEDGKIAVINGVDEESGAISRFYVTQVLDMSEDEVGYMVEAVTTFYNNPFCNQFVSETESGSLEPYFG